ncbi:uncharacterized protein B0I36DRAFT_436738 [Microdochium trichocladiopsis]|uniref:Uncharacterized protein n=1 Tax=Microdochium trichocladiopsis TaxID=1682393 RepID=A0A9P8XQD4_9PEZI|nr:uncharacterized protein B0I36DRAFT_436738 [Microdochium trichocladiopsis]KAH7012055.1 hypothetical protein B0I36DRAFT_436738 [Microdochium trichocladiopsis]
MATEPDIDEKLPDEPTYAQAWEYLQRHGAIVVESPELGALMKEVDGGKYAHEPRAYKTFLPCLREIKKISPIFSVLPENPQNSKTYGRVAEHYYSVAPQPTSALAFAIVSKESEWVIRFASHKKKALCHPDPTGLFVFHSLNTFGTEGTVSLAEGGVKSVVGMDCLDTWAAFPLARHNRALGIVDPRTLLDCKHAKLACLEFFHEFGLCILILDALHHAIGSNI